MVINDPVFQAIADIGIYNSRQCGDSGSMPQELETPLYFAPTGFRENPTLKRSNAHDIVGAECRAVRESVGLLDISGFFEVSAGIDPSTLLPADVMVFADGFDGGTTVNLALGTEIVTSAAIQSSLDASVIEVPDEVRSSSVPAPATTMLVVLGLLSFGFTRTGARTRS